MYFLPLLSILKEKLNFGFLSLLNKNMTQTIIGNSVLDKYFDETTMSLHLKVNRPILRKKGFPGNWQPVVDPNEIMTKEAFNELIDQLFKEVESREDAFLEINRELSKVLQI